MKNRKSALAAAVASAAVLAAVPASALAVAPGPPPGQTLIPQSFTSSPGVPIPDGSANDEATSVPGVVTNTINVTGAGAALTDLDIGVNITHSFSPDLTIALTSPAGTVVTLVSRVPQQPGAENYPPYEATAGYGDLFINTTFDDQATSPAASNDYGSAAAPIPADKLIPEEALAAFLGQNPNGVWTLTVSDKLLGDVGNFSQWRMNLNSVAAVPSISPEQVFNSVPPPLTIPDNGGKVSSSVNVSGVTGQLWDVNVRTVLSHNETRDMVVNLISPDGVTVPLSVRRGGGQWFGSTLWNDSAEVLVTDEPPATDGIKPTLVPEGALGQLIGTNPNGEWKIEAQDFALEDAGTLSLWDLRIRAAGAPGAAPPVSGDANRAPADVRSDDVCKTVPKPKKGAKSGKVLRNAAGMGIQQRQAVVALSRIAGIQKWLKSGVRTRDLCGYAFGSKDFKPTIQWAGGAIPPAAVRANPRKVAVRVPAKKKVKFRFTAGQAATNDNVAKAALKRAQRLRIQFKNLTGSDLKVGAVGQAQLSPGTKLVAKGGSPSSAKSKLGSIKISKTKKGATTNSFLLKSQRRTQSAITIANAIIADIQSGLTGANFKNGSIGANRLGGDVN